MKQIRNDYLDSELTAIAKIIQLYCKFNLTTSYKKVCDLFALTKDMPANDKNKALEVLASSLNPSNNPLCKYEINIFDLLKPVYDPNYNGDGYTLNAIEHLSSFRLPSIGNITDELKAVITEHGGFNFEDNIITSELGPFEINEINFGKFQVSFGIDLLCSSDYCANLSVEALDPNYPGSRTSFSHPHVDHNMLCVGNGKKPLFKASRQMRLSDMYSIISSILSTYGKDPHISIEAWTGFECGDCGRYYDQDSHTICTKCESGYCNDCIKICCDLGQLVCGSCESSRYECMGCYKKMCVECVDLCKDCNFKFCSQHVGNNYHCCNKVGV